MPIVTTKGRFITWNVRKVKKGRIIQLAKHGEPQGKRVPTILEKGKTKAYIRKQ